MSYIDGFLFPVPNAKRERYFEIATLFAEIFKDCGATRSVETWGDDIPEGKVTSFPQAVQKKPDEGLVLALVWWPSKEARDEGIRKFREDPRYKAVSDAPVDGQRMVYGGFEIVLDTDFP